ncbi:hypothetical protein Sgleb_05310 [Streptomyces glebosus]|uniref:Uncharacterized protein n=1 Tax=Streptomyces glebosus TaxID=249580 RepID=A0A640SNK2_9ACTN|nr:hypothetical protein Sgleb_05310 [Streptomyces glebosus]GHG70855.1 hypothetical protein GCM10010513_42510 [Streptomyces glebosus]
MRAGRGNHEAGLLVVPDGAQRQFGPCGSLADLHVLAVHARDPLVLLVLTAPLNGPADLYPNVRVELLAAVASLTSAVAVLGPMALPVKIPMLAGEKRARAHDAWRRRLPAVRLRPRT